MLSKFGERYFILKNAEDAEKLNGFLVSLEDREIPYDTDSEDIGSDSEVAVLVTVTWGE